MGHEQRRKCRKPTARKPNHVDRCARLRSARVVRLSRAAGREEKLQVRRAQRRPEVGQDEGRERDRARLQALALLNLKKGMSALPPKADMCGALGDVRYVPCVDMCHDVLDECQTATKRLQDLSRHPCCEGSVNEALVRRSGWHSLEAVHEPRDRAMARLVAIVAFFLLSIPANA